MKESGDIEDMADHILLGWKVDANGSDQPALRRIKLAKNRDGLEASEMQAVTMRWDRKTASFQHTPSEALGESMANEYDNLTSDFAEEAYP